MQGAKRAERSTKPAERSSEFLSPLFFASYSDHPTAEPDPRLHFQVIGSRHFSLLYGGGGGKGGEGGEVGLNSPAKYSIMRSSPPDIFSFH